MRKDRLCSLAEIKAMHLNQSEEEYFFYFLFCIAAVQPLRRVLSSSFLSNQSTSLSSKTLSYDNELDSWGFYNRRSQYSQTRGEARLSYVKLCCGLWQTKTKLHGRLDSAKALAVVLLFFKIKINGSTGKVNSGEKMDNLQLF